MFFREELTFDLPTLECRMTSSEEDIRSTDDLDSTGDDLDCGTAPDQDEYAATFDLPGMYAYMRTVHSSICLIILE